MKKLINPNLQFIWRDLMNVPGRRMALVTLVIVLAGAALEIASPYGLGLVLEAVRQKETNIALVGLGVYVGLELASIGLGWFRMRVRERMFQENFWHIPMRLTELYFARPLSKLIGEDNEIDGGGVESIKGKVWNVTATYIYNIFPNYGLTLFAVTACTFAHPLAGLFAGIYVGLDLAIGYRQNRYLTKVAQPIIDEFHRWERRIREWWNATPLIKQNGVESRIIKQVQAEVQPALAADDRVWRQFFPVVVLGRRLISLLGATVLYTVSGYEVFQGNISVPAFVLLLFSFERLRNVLESINEQHRELGRDLPSIDKYRQVLQAPIPFHYSVGAPFAEETIGLRFAGVSLALGEGEERRPVLEDVSFTIAPGERIGIVGPSGAGKTQLINLILRGSDPDSGVVYVNQHDLRTLALQSYLRFCGIIPQKSDLFEDTVQGNIMFGVSNQDWTRFTKQVDVEERVWAALRKAGLDFGNRLTEGLSTKVGYKGMRLSGGQQARLRIADAHFKLAAHLPDRPRLIIADEPTASLDSLSEIAVMENLTDALPLGTTVLMIAHRLSTVANMDRIMFVRPLTELREGQPQVTLHQSLAELYATDALFREMADAQNFRP